MSSDNLQTRKRILDAAWALLEEHQGKGVRMSDIARRAEVSRQALYLHFATRADLLIATTRHVDEIKDIERRLEPSRTAPSGEARLEAYIDAWGNYLPEIHSMARALMAAQDADEAAQAAWEDRMQAVRHGCAAAIDTLEKEGRLRPENSVESATDILWTLLSVRNWEQFTRQCGWSQDQYIATLKAMARRLLVADDNDRCRNVDVRHADSGSQPGW